MNRPPSTTRSIAARSSSASGSSGVRVSNRGTGMCTGRCGNLPAVKAVILAGGVGSRLTEETSVRPKPMVEIGGKPVLWHIMKIYEAHGITDFVICLGYKGYVIKE